MNEAQEIPLVDLLLDIPETYRIEYPAAYDEDGNPIGYRLFPVGLLAHKAAKRIAELEDRLETLTTCALNALSIMPSGREKADLRDAYDHAMKS